MEGWLRQRVRDAASTTNPSVSKTTAAKPSAQKSSAAQPLETGGSAQVPKSAKSPSTIRRLVAQADKELAKATAARDRLSDELRSAASGGGDHTRLASISENLAHAQAEVDRAEEAWITLAAEAEARGIDMNE